MSDEFDYIEFMKPKAKRNSVSSLVDMSTYQPEIIDISRYMPKAVDLQTHVPETLEFDDMTSRSSRHRPPTSTLLLAGFTKHPPTVGNLMNYIPPTPIYQPNGGEFDDLIAKRQCRPPQTSGSPPVIVRNVRNVDNNMAPIVVRSVRNVDAITPPIPSLPTAHIQVRHPSVLVKAIRRYTGTPKNTFYWEDSGWERRGDHLIGSYKVGKRSYAGSIELSDSVVEPMTFYIYDPPREIIKGPHGACFRYKGVVHDKQKYFVHFSEGPADVDSGIIQIQQDLHKAVGQY